MATIEFRGVSKRYPDGTEAVRSLDLTILDGEFTILVGPSGCGKSTVLRMLAGLENVTTGEILIDGETVNDRHPKDRDIAMIFQNYALYPHMDVASNMGFALSLAGVPKREIRERVGAVAEILDLTDQLDRRPARLSGGQRQRVAMGRAIVREPKAFLMDEPLSNLDAKLRVQMRAEIAQIQRRLGTTSVYVTHDQTEAMTLGDRVVVMDGGVIQQVGRPLDLYQHPANTFVAGFIGSPSMNFLAGRRRGEEVLSRFGAIPRPAAAAAAADGEELILGLRPQAFQEVDGSTPERGVVFTAAVETLESVGSETFAYCRPLDRGDDPDGESLPDRVAGQICARLEATTRVRVGDRAQLWFDPAQAHVFAADGAVLASP